MTLHSNTFYHTMLCYMVCCHYVSVCPSVYSSITSHCSTKMDDMAGCPYKELNSGQKGVPQMGLFTVT